MYGPARVGTGPGGERHGDLPGAIVAGPQARGKGKGPPVNGPGSGSLSACFPCQARENAGSRAADGGCLPTHPCFTPEAYFHAAATSALVAVRPPVGGPTSFPPPPGHRAIEGARSARGRCGARLCQPDVRCRPVATLVHGVCAGRPPLRG